MTPTDRTFGKQLAHLRIFTMQQCESHSHGAHGTQQGPLGVAPAAAASCPRVLKFFFYFQNILCTSRPDNERRSRDEKLNRALRPFVAHQRVRSRLAATLYDDTSVGGCIPSLCI